MCFEFRTTYSVWCAHASTRRNENGILYIGKFNQRHNDHGWNGIFFLSFHFDKGSHYHWRTTFNAQITFDAFDRARLTVHMWYVKEISKNWTNGQTPFYWYIKNGRIVDRFEVERLAKTLLGNTKNRLYVLLLLSPCSVICHFVYHSI